MFITFVIWDTSWKETNLQGMRGRWWSLKVIVHFFGRGKLEVNIVVSVIRPFFRNLTSPSLLQPLQWSLSQLLPVLTPLPCGCVPLAPPRPRNRFALRPSLSCHGLSFQGALSSRETKCLLLLPQVPRQWGRRVCQSSQDENNSRIQKLSIVTVISYELPQVAKLGHREDEPIHETPSSGGPRQQQICCWEDLSLLTQVVKCQAMSFPGVKLYFWGEN